MLIMRRWEKREKEEIVELDVQNYYTVDEQFHADDPKYRGVVLVLANQYPAHRQKSIRDFSRKKTNILFECSRSCYNIVRVNMYV